MATRLTSQSKRATGGRSTPKGNAAGGDGAAQPVSRGLLYHCGNRTLTFDWVTLSGFNLVHAYVHVSSTRIQNFQPTTSRKSVDVTTVPYTGGATGSSTSPLYPTTGDGKVYAYVWFLYTRAEGGTVGDCGDGGNGEGDRAVRKSRSGKKTDARLTSGGLYNCGYQSLIVEWPAMTGYHRDIAFVHVGSQAIPDLLPTTPHTVAPTHEHDFEGDNTIFAYSPNYPTLGDGEVFGYAWLGYTRGQGGEVADCGIIEAQ